MTPQEKRDAIELLLTKEKKLKREVYNLSVSTTILKVIYKDGSDFEVELSQEEKEIIKSNRQQQLDSINQQIDELLK